MTEKGDGGSDTVSLPPTYAPSEAYTESPPPAYRGGGVGSGKVVQIVKLLCMTAVLIALLTGFFVLSSNYMRTRACSCEPRPLDSVEGRAALLQAGFLAPPPPPIAEALVEEAKKEEEKEENSLDAGDDTVLGDEQVEALVEEVVQAEEALEHEMEEVVEEEEAALQDILNAQADHMKKIKLPVDLILGNPNLAGREVSCEVERRQVPLAPGVLSQTILVTCKDDDDNKDDIPPSNGSIDNRPSPINRSQRPPMSLLAPLMKMLTSRPGPQPRLVPVSLRGPINLMPQQKKVMQEFPMRPPFSMMPQKARIFPMGPMSPMGPLSPVSMRGPVALPRTAPEGPGDRTDRMLPRHLQPIVRLSPRFLSHSREDSNKINLVGLQRGALPLPQAKPRALPRPINMSPFPSRPIMPSFLPFNVLRDAPPPPHHPATHMEMKQRPKDFASPRKHTIIQTSSQRHPSFTPPQAIRVHTLPRGLLTPPGSSPVHMEASPQRFEASSPRLDAPPRQFAPQGRRSDVTPNVHPEAEIIGPLAGSRPSGPPMHPAAPPPHPSDVTPSRKHHLLMVH